MCLLENKNYKTIFLFVFSKIWSKKWFFSPVFSQVSKKNHFIPFFFGRTR